MKRSVLTHRCGIVGFAVVYCMLPSAGQAVTPSKTPLARAASPSAKREHILKFGGLLRSDAPRQMSAAELAQVGLPVLTLRTSFKDEAPARFAGVSLAQIASRFGAPGVTKVRVIAANKYEQTLPLLNWKGPNVVLAFTQNGQPMAPSARGTFRLVMNVAGLSDARREALYPYFVW